MNERRYIVSVENSSGNRVYFRRSENYAGGSPVTVDPNLAQQWKLTDQKTDIITHVDRFRRNISNSSELKVSTVRIEVYEWTTTPIDGVDAEWVQILRDNALLKLTSQEIESLGISNLEVFRRLKQ